MASPPTVGEVAERFGEAQGLARSTILTVMERLRKKGHLTRGKVEGVFRVCSTAGDKNWKSGVLQPTTSHAISKRKHLSPITDQDTGRTDAR